MMTWNRRIDPGLVEALAEANVSTRRQTWKWNLKCRDSTWPINRLRGCPRAAAEQMNQQRDDGKDEEQVNHEPCHVKKYEAASPQNYQKYR
jgi:hypothetical protein